MTVGVLGRNAYGMFENFARFIGTTLLPEHKTQIDEGPGVLRVGFRHLAIAALGVGVMAGLYVIVSLPLDWSAQGAFAREARSAMGIAAPDASRPILFLSHFNTAVTSPESSSAHRGRLPQIVVRAVPDSACIESHRTATAKSVEALLRSLA